MEQVRELEAQLAEARKDTARLDWVLPIMSCTDGPESETDERALRVAGALMLGKTGRDAIDAARGAK